MSFGSVFTLSLYISQMTDRICLPLSFRNNQAHQHVTEEEVGRRWYYF